MVDEIEDDDKVNNEQNFVGGSYLSTHTYISIYNKDSIRNGIERW